VETSSIKKIETEKINRKNFAKESPGLARRRLLKIKNDLDQQSAQLITDGEKLKKFQNGYKKLG